MWAAFKARQRRRERIIGDCEKKEKPEGKRFVVGTSYVCDYKAVSGAQASAKPEQFFNSLKLQPPKRFKFDYCSSSRFDFLTESYSL